MRPNSLLLRWEEKWETVRRSKFIYYFSWKDFYACFLRIQAGTTVERWEPRKNYLKCHLNGRIGSLKPLPRSPRRRGLGQTTESLRSEMEAVFLISSQAGKAFCGTMQWFILFTTLDLQKGAYKMKKTEEFQNKTPDPTVVPAKSQIFWGYNRSEGKNLPTNRSSYRSDQEITDFKRKGM